MRKDKELKTELIFGIHPIIELLKAKKRKIMRIYTTEPEPKALANIKKLFPKYPVEIHHRSRQELTHMADSIDHQGILALAAPFMMRAKPFDPKQHPALIMLDGIQDPRNVGAILRSAYCTGFQGVVITQKNTAPLNAVCLKASAGLAEHLDIRQVPSAIAGVLELKQAGYQVYITALDKRAQSAADIDYQLPLCVVIGSEATGVSPAILKLGTTIMLPQRVADISYNASVAAALCMFIIAEKKKLFVALQK